MISPAGERGDVFYPQKTAKTPFFHFLPTFDWYFFWVLWV